MDPQTSKLVSALEDCSVMLVGCSEAHWAGVFTECASLLKAGNFRGIEKLEGFFGGCGSVNDLVLHPMNGHTIEESELDHYNERLQQYVSRFHQLAKEVRKNASF